MTEGLLTSEKDYFAWWDTLTPEQKRKYEARGAAGDYSWGAPKGFHKMLTERSMRRERMMKK